MSKKSVLYISCACVVMGIVAVYCAMFYPRQSMPVGTPLEVTTIDPLKYQNDCLHPCIRHDDASGKYYMAQSPYYGWNNKVENPMFYVGETYTRWYNGALISDTPSKGYNSDPNIWITDSARVFFLWRECETSLCDSLGCVYAIVSGTIENNSLREKRVLCVNANPDGDVVQCPILIEHNGMYYIYAAWYMYKPERKNLGVAIWQSASLAEPSFVLQDTLVFPSVYTVDKCAQVRLLGHIFYMPKPLYHDLWHFDLFEFDNRLWMVSVAEKGDNIMLSVSDDWRHFKTYRTPLVNNHYTENYCGYRQYYYKPTAFVENDTLHLFYTANAQDDPNRNQLFHTCAPMKEIVR